MVSIALALKKIPLNRITFIQYPGNAGQTEAPYAGKVKPDAVLGAQLMALVAADQPFVLATTGDGRGSQPDTSAPTDAPVTTPTPGSTDTPTPTPSQSLADNTGLPVLSGVSGQTAADRTCSIANDY
jgi:hypothetical protein